MTTRCRTCDDARIERYGFCPSCWTAAKFGFRRGVVLAGVLGFLIGLLA